MTPRTTDTRLKDLEARMDAVEQRLRTPVPMPPSPPARKPDAGADDKGRVDAEHAKPEPVRVGKRVPG